MALPFQRSRKMTLGVELELQLVSRQTRNLHSAAQELVERAGRGSRHIKPELFQSMIEINTGICADAAEAERDLRNALQRLEEHCGELGVDLVSAGSHPFALYLERQPYPTERFTALLDRNQWIAQRLVIFGMHVHVGMRDGEHAMAMINGILPYLPHLLALSVSSPFWQGRDTGLASSRTTIFEASPTAGHPCTFADWRAFEDFFDAARASHAIGSIKDIWWDIRPHPDYGTVELRICDALPILAENVAVAGLVHLLFQWLDGRWRAGERFAPLPEWVLRENKWRASRWGLEAEVVLDARGRSRPLREDLEDLLRRLRNEGGGLASLESLDTIAMMLARRSSAERQRQVFGRRGSLEDVVAALVEELRTGMPVS